MVKLTDREVAGLIALLEVASDASMLTGVIDGDRCKEIITQLQTMFRRSSEGDTFKLEKE